MENNYTKLASIDVSKYVEKKGPHKLDYLPWSDAVDFLMRADPMSTWEFHTPMIFNETLMVSCTVTAFGKPITMHLPVMDHSNRAVKNPDALIVNKNMMRCLVKAIACHGLGIQVYRGEDLPVDNVPQIANVPKNPAAEAKILACKTPDELATLWLEFSVEERKATVDVKNELKEKFIKKGLAV
jgi:hypothetical protein